MTKDEIVLEIVLAMIEHGSAGLKTNSDNENGKTISDLFNTIYNSIKTEK